MADVSRATAGGEWGETSLVGRRTEMALLRARLAVARSGRAQFVLLRGEPGIGKTRLLEEMAVLARLEGLQVLRGRCWEGGGAPAYWPWIQILRGPFRTVAATADGSNELSDAARRIGSVVPELGRLLDVPAVSAIEAGDAEEARFRLFDAVGELLRELCRRDPLVVIVDDLQGADVASLLLFRFIVHELRDARLLVVGGSRAAQAAGSRETKRLLATLFRDTEEIALRGLREDDVARMVELRTGRAGTQPTVQRLHRTTAGNPLFLDEILRLVVARGQPTSLDGESWSIEMPDRVKELIRRHLEPLSRAARDTLITAAMLGNEFESGVLQLACDSPADAVLDAVNEGIACGLLARMDTKRFAFRHALVRETLCRNVGAEERVRCHRRIGAALEALHGADDESHLAQLAYHFREAAPAGGDVTKAVEYGARAARQAIALLAYEEGVSQLQASLEALVLMRSPHARQRTELLLALGEAQHLVGEPEQARASFLAAFELAGNLGDAGLLARAALGCGGAWFFMVEIGKFDPVLVDLLERSLAALGEEMTALRSRVAARLATELYYSPEVERRDRLSRLAVDVAQGAGDVGALANALAARAVAIWGPETTVERLALATESLRLATAAGIAEIEPVARWARCVALLEQGEIDTFDLELDALHRLAEQRRQPSWLWASLALRACRALFEGRFGEVERLIRQALAQGQRAQPRNAPLAFGVQMALLRREQDALDGIEGVLRSLAGQYPAIPGYRLAIGFLAAELGHAAESRLVLEAHLDSRLGPRDARWMSAAALAVEIASLIGDTTGSEQLYEALLPHASVNACASFVGVCFGSVSRLLGMLAMQMSRWTEADAHFARAAEQNQRMGAKPWVAYTQVSHAAMLRARGGPGDEARAAELLARARALARELGMTSLLRKMEKTRDGQAGPPSSASTERPMRELARDSVAAGSAGGDAASEAYVLRHEGEHWTARFGNEITRLRDAKGLHYLAHLLRHPGEEFHVLEIVGGALESGLDALDSEDRDAVRGRLAELDEQLADAHAIGDSARALRFEEEIDTLARRVAGAVGHAHGERRAGSAGERARINVTRAIKGVLQKLDESSPALAGHLRRTIRTGTFCSYNPDPRVPIHWAS